LTVFTPVVDVGSLSAASRELNMSLAVVSKRLARLESRLGVRLINRTTCNLGMTDEGKEFYKRCVRILADITDAEDSVGTRKNRASGLLRVTATAAFARRQLGVRRAMSSSGLMPFLFSKTRPKRIWGLRKHSGIGGNMTGAGATGLPPHRFRLSDHLRLRHGSHLV
jgi:molybdenum-dependent DNA-binding transcriptional regulator ModE